MRARSASRASCKSRSRPKSSCAAWPPPCANRAASSSAAAISAPTGVASSKPTMVPTGAFPGCCRASPPIRRASRRPTQPGPRCRCSKRRQLPPFRSGPRLSRANKMAIRNGHPSRFNPMSPPPWLRAPGTRLRRRPRTPSSRRDRQGAGQPQARHQPRPAARRWPQPSIWKRRSAIKRERPSAGSACWVTTRPPPSRSPSTWRPLSPTMATG